MGQGTAGLCDEDAPGTFILARACPEGLHQSSQEAAGGCCSLQGCAGTGPSFSSWFSISQPSPIPAYLSASLPASLMPNLSI